jgi:hypothetical protein
LKKIAVWTYRPIAPALFAPEGIFRNLEGIKEYLTVEKKEYDR